MKVRFDISYINLETDDWLTVELRGVPEWIEYHFRRALGHLERVHRFRGKQINLTDLVVELPNIHVADGVARDLGDGVIVP